MALQIQQQDRPFAPHARRLGRLGFRRQVAGVKSGTAIMVSIQPLRTRVGVLRQREIRNLDVGRIAIRVS
jgi:hypothetical protein